MSAPRIDNVLGAGPYTIQAYSVVKDYRTVTHFHSAEVRDEWIAILMEYGFDIEGATDHGQEVQLPSRAVMQGWNRGRFESWR